MTDAQRWQPSASVRTLKQRAKIVADIRRFFDDRSVLEVETPCLGLHSVTDPQIESIPADRASWLQTSPEYYMKRMLAGGFPDVYQIARVFRAGEAGRHHEKEFSLVEWYRLGFDDVRLASEVVELIETLAQERECKLQLCRVSYAELFSTLGLSADSEDCGEYEQLLISRGIDCPAGLDAEQLADLVFATLLRPTFAGDCLTVVGEFPSRSAALARLDPENPRVARRFEVFWGELELANGFYELCDSAEQRRRFDADNALRLVRGLSPMSVDQALLAALDAGLPDCAGVALGLDRLAMKLLGKGRLAEVMAFAGYQDRVNQAK